jgi:ABC-type lipoprotein export system ATPase subunit
MENNMKEIILESPILQDDYTAIVEKMFDVPISDKSIVVIKNNIKLPEKWNIGLIYGASGAGKSTLLKEFGEIKAHKWDNKKPMISNFTNVTPEQASEVLCSVGFGTVPSWIRPYNVLSMGEKFRADLARSLVSNDKIILVDEYSSFVDRMVAKSTSNSLQKYIRKHNKKIILASCHYDILEWLQPDFSYNPNEGETKYFARGCLCRPQIKLKIFRTKYEAWDLFKHHHYLNAELNKSARCYMATWEDVPVGFIAILSFPHPFMKNCWRESRTVVLPEFQGFGIGIKLSNYFGSLIKCNGGRFFSKTVHPSLIAFRLKNPELWRETSHSREARNPAEKSMKSRGWDTTTRFCYAFEYIGPASSKDEAILFSK